MPHLSITLKAGQATRQTFGQARFLTLQSLGDAAVVDVDIEVAGFAQESLRSLRANDRIAVGGNGFQAATFKSATDCTIDVIASMIDVRLNNNEGQTVQANIVGTVPVEVMGPDPLQVATTRGGAPGTPFFVSGLTYNDTPAASRSDNAVVGVTGTSVAFLLGTRSNRLRAVFTNIGVDPVAIGGATLTWAKRCIVIQPGDSWVEDKGAALDWSAICDAGKLASVTVQELLA